MAKSLATATSPYFERVFLDRSWGFRPDRGTLKMLARLEADILATRRFVLAVADIRRAFDSVRIAGVLTAHQQLFDEDLADHIVPSDQDKILALIGATLRGHDPNKEVGIDQGNPYSPLALNVLLHTVHDVPRNADVRLPLWYRYADNLVYACHSVTDGRQVLEHIRQTHVSHNLALKGTAGVYDLRKDEEVPLLGFRIRLNRDRLCYGIGEHAYTSLREHLINAHDKPNPPEAARNSLLGWVMSMGPAVEAAEAAIKVAMDIAQRCGFREIPSHAQLLEYWQQAGETWERLRRAVRRRF